MFKALLCGCFLGVCLVAQTIAGAGYLVAAPVSVAPGQILTFFVDGVAVHGVTATLRQGSDVTAPVIGVQPISTCSPVLPQTSCGSLVGVTVQIPYELTPACLLCAKPLVLLTELIISGNGQSAEIQLNAVADQVHVLTACDIVLNPTGSLASGNTGGLPCSPVVTHADGTMVTASSPANPGEELTAWATGLGATNPPAVTGQLATKSLPTAETLGINFNYSVNALATKPRPAAVVGPVLTPIYSGLTPGFVGLYQVNFIVPAGPPNGIARCSLPGTYAAGSNPVLSNLTVSFGGGFSFDGAGICVATQIPVD